MDPQHRSRRLFLYLQRAKRWHCSRLLASRARRPHQIHHRPRLLYIFFMVCHLSLTICQHPSYGMSSSLCNRHLGLARGPPARPARSLRHKHAIPSAAFLCLSSPRRRSAPTPVQRGLAGGEHVGTGSGGGGGRRTRTWPISMARSVQSRDEGIWKGMPNGTIGCSLS